MHRGIGSPPEGQEVGDRSMAKHVVVVGLVCEGCIIRTLLNVPSTAVYVGFVFVEVM